MEEGLLYSSKGHFAASGIWSNFHLVIGVPAAILAAIASAAALRKFDPEGIVSAVCSMIVVVLTAVMTFLNPNSKASAHLNAGNSYDSLMNRVRIFWSIDCWRTEGDEVLVERLNHMSEQKDKLNQTCPQIPHWAYLIAKRGIAAGEGRYSIDGKDGP